MAINRILERDHELSLQEEATYGLDPGVVVGADFFKAQPTPDAVQRVIARYDRDQDRDHLQASVLSTQKGREMANITIPGDLIPSGNGTTPTPPDMDLLFKACLGSVRTATAHTTTDAGSSGVTLVLVVGGGAASGLQAGDLFAVDVDPTFGYEVRECVEIVTDTVTMDRALSADPGTGRDVKVGTTYELLESSLISLYLKRFLLGVTGQRAVPGVIIPDMSISIDTAQDAPIAKVSFTGEGKAEISHADARPTTVTLGEPLLPGKSYAWFGATRLCIAGAASLHVNNGLELRKNESCSLEPTGVKRTGNSSRYLVDAAVELLATTGDEDTIAIYDAIQALTPQDLLVQLGVTPGAIVAWRCPRFIPDPGFTSRDGEMGLSIGGGRCYGTVNNDEVKLAFI